MINSFNTNIAVKYSVEVAIFLQHIAQWSLNNLSHNKHIHDGYVWTYNTHEGLKKFFPYWSTDQIRRVIKKAVDEGLVQKGNYNKTKYDHTCWYALTDQGGRLYPELSISEIATKQSMSDETKSPDQRREITEPIPTINTTSKKDINIKTLISKKDSCLPALKKLNSKDAEEMDMMLADNPHDIPLQMLLDWKMVRRGKKKSVTKTAWNRVNSALNRIVMKLSIPAIEAFSKMVSKEWISLEFQYFVQPQGKQQNNNKDNFTNSTWK